MKKAGFFNVYACIYYHFFMIKSQKQMMMFLNEKKTKISLLCIYINVAAIIFGVLLLFKFNILHGIVLVFFFFFWIAYAVVFMTCDTYYYITNSNSPFQNIYSYNDYLNLLKNWNTKNPNIKLKYQDENNTHACQSASLIFTSKSSVHVNN